MLYEPHSEFVYCEKCKKWYNIRTGTYLPEGCENEGPIHCLAKDHLVGYTWDVPEIYLPDYKPQKHQAE